MGPSAVGPLANRRTLRSHARSPSVRRRKAMRLEVLSRLLRSVGGAALAALALAAGAQPASPPQAAAHRFSSAPIPERYIVVFRDHVADPASEAAALARSEGGQVHFTYRRALKGFAATLPQAAVERLRNHPNVAFVEQDQEVSLQQLQQENQATWGLDRIDQVDLPLDTIYFFGASGAGVTAFIIDTGIRADHVEFTGRVLPGFTAISDGRGTDDCDGHGTHVSGTVGGTTWGVAKQVALVPVRVLNCKGSGSFSGVIAGVDWVAANPRRPAVANMSLGGSVSSSVNAAVAGAVASGVTMVVAAGNSNADACKSSPSSEPSALTVGATTTTDARASYSNFGPCLDLFAPGSSIKSAWNTSATATNTISGTSMATPHVTGAAALVLQSNPGASPAAVGAFLTSHATANHVGAAGTGSPNLLLYSLAAGAATEPVKPTVAVSNIVGSSSRSGRNWKATATVTIQDLATGSPVANVTVAGSFAPGGSGTCTTGGNGSCAISSGAIAPSLVSTVFTVTGASGNVVYDGTHNWVNTATIAKP
jgi:aqualysin 1